MPVYSAVVERDGEITIPEDAVRALGLRIGDSVTIHAAEGRLLVAPTDDPVARTAGIIRTTGPALSPKELREVAEQAIADDVVERMSRK